ncbi:MAG: AMP-binding protein [Marinifilaceae bacterium]|jgi:long-chain acyl-CoA synthetase|nr:AMP-binding protein [Marinifilaceae bacterium]
MGNNNLISAIKDSIYKNWDNPCFSNYKKDSLTYKQVAEKIYFIHNCFKFLGIEEGDKIALIGRNLNNWAVTYIASITYGATIVPILPDFSTGDIHHILNHSDAKLLFTTDNIFNKIDDNQLKKIIGIISLNEFEILCDSPNEQLSKAYEFSEMLSYNNPLDKENLEFSDIDNEAMAVLSYTSGTSGFSKGVMIPYRSLYSNVKIGFDHIDLQPKDNVVSFLPLAHVFGCMFEFLTEFCMGCHIHFLSRVPSPQVITKSFMEIKPKLICAVPLILEKIYKKKIVPVLNRKRIKLMLKLPFFEKKIYQKIKDNLVQNFGGNFIQVIVGGAALNKEVEDFFKKIGFPFTVGYGMTECGPLVSYTPYEKFIQHSCGGVVDRMEVRIDSEDPYNVVGEIQVKGENVMLGYYKNEEATKEVFTDDGWLRTGDLGLIDTEQTIFIKGRSKNMLLGPSGQNIYPEEIETMLNNMEYIQESVVTEDDNHKLIALIYPDYELCDSIGMTKDQIQEEFNSNIATINKQLPAYMNLSRAILYPEEFEKTPKRNIKRYLYTGLYKK